MKKPPPIGEEIGEIIGSESHYNIIIMIGTIWRVGGPCLVSCHNSFVIYADYPATHTHFCLINLLSSFCSFPSRRKLVFFPEIFAKSLSIQSRPDYALLCLFYSTEAPRLDLLLFLLLILGPNPKVVNYN